MSAEYQRVLFVFVDGVGLAPASDHNPWAVLPAPALARRLGGPLTLEQCQEGDDLVLAAIDANLDVDGLPQSATGQAALFTGVNAAEVMGRHVTGLPGPQVRALVESGNLLQRARRMGLRSTFANAYTRPYLDAVGAGERRPSVTTCTVSSAGLPFRQLEELERNEAVSWDILRDRFGGHGGGVLPEVEASEAGQHLSSIAASHDLTVFETFVPDMAGHRRWGFEAADAVGRIDGLLEGIWGSGDSHTTLVLTSDHGNLEDDRTRRHTRNPVPLLATGPLAREFVQIRSILDVTPAILSCFEGSQ